MKYPYNFLKVWTTKTIYYKGQKVKVSFFISGVHWRKEPDQISKSFWTSVHFHWSPQHFHIYKLCVSTKL